MDTVHKGLVAAAAVAVGIAAGATGIALADENVTASPTASSSVSEPGEDATRDPGARKDRRPRDARHRPGMFAGRGALHGEFVVPRADGGFRTLVMQRGAVTAVSPTSISVRSEDGFTTTYVVTADTLVNAARDGIDTIEKGAQVNVVAARAGNKVTALRIGDRSARKALREGLGLDGAQRRT